MTPGRASGEQFRPRGCLPETEVGTWCLHLIYPVSEIILPQLRSEEIAWFDFDPSKQWLNVKLELLVRYVWVELMKRSYFGIIFKWVDKCT